MPTILNSQGHRLFFFDNEREEPPRVHVEKDGNYAKFWLCPVAVVKSVGYSASEIRELRQIVSEHRNQLEETWHEWFDNP